VLAGHARQVALDLGRGIRETGRDLRAQRDDEIQADELSVLLVARAGYDPHAVETMLRAIAAGQDDAGDSADPHPSWTERLARVQALVAREASGGERRADRFRAKLARLVVGDDPRVAAAIGHAIVMSRAQIAIDLPRWQSAAANTRGFEITLTSGELVSIRAVPRSLVTLIPDSTVDGGAIVTYTGRAGSVAITVSGPHAGQLANALRAAIREPKPSELAQLHRELVDFGAPRRLWPG
jgi:hypothetical protein